MKRSLENVRDGDMQKFLAIPNNNFPKVPDYYQQKFKKAKRN